MAGLRREIAAVWRPAVRSDLPATVVEGQVLVRDEFRPATTIEAYRAAISVAHRSAGVENPCAHEAVRRAVAAGSAANAA